MNWTDCPYVEIDPDGFIMVKGIARDVPAEALIVNHADGVSIAELAYIYECPEHIVRGIIDYWKSPK